ncbi:MAG TPA: molybdopterin cofactor-binding domain-containing protein, partial [Alphaproteobacteria bacterium]
MAPYIGTPTSRVDGRAKVTGAARYAAEFNRPDMVHGCVVTATITRGRIARIDTSAALGTTGVIAVLTHENRPAMAEDDEAYKDDTAPDGTPFRPLYDGVIRFDRQPIAVVLAESWDIARSAAALVRTEYEAAAHETDLEGRAGAASASATNGFAVVDTTAPRGDAEKAFAAAEVRHQASYRIPVEHHNPKELFGSTVIWEGGGRITVYDKTQGVQNVHKYL